MQFMPAGKRLEKELTAASVGARQALVSLFSDREMAACLDFLERISNSLCPPTRTALRPKPRHQKNKASSRSSLPPALRVPTQN